MTDHTASHFSPIEAKIVRALEAAPKGLTHLELIDAVYGDDPDGGPYTADNAVKVHIHRIRRKLPADRSIVRHNGCGRYQLAAVGSGSAMPSEPKDVLTPRQMELYTIIRRRPGIGTDDLAAIMGRGRSLVSALTWRANKVLPALGKRIAGRARYGFRVVECAPARAAA